MKRIVAVFLLVVFCSYSLIYKTHFCYYAGKLKGYKADDNAAAGTLDLSKTVSRYFYAGTHEVHKLVKTPSELHKVFTTTHFFADDVVSPQQETRINFYAVRFIILLIPEGDCHSSSVSVFSPLRGPPVC